MEITHIIPHVEALIFASDHPLPAMEIMELLNNSQGFLDDTATPDQVMSAIEAIREKYESEFYSFGIRESGGGFQFLTKPDYYSTVAQLNGDKYLKKLSTAALETLAIIAYKQPITKGDIESIRGVNSDYSIQKLLEKELIVIAGRKEEAPGKPLIYTTSKSFMDYFGINTPEDLPKIKEVLQEELAHPTFMQDVPGENGPSGEEEEPVSGGRGYLAVSENGELLINDQTPDTEDETPGIENTGGIEQEETEEGNLPENETDEAEKDENGENNPHDEDEDGEDGNNK